MINKVFPPLKRFARLCIITGAALCVFGIFEFYSYRSVFASEVSRAATADIDTFWPIQEVSIAMLIYGLAAIVGGIGLAFHKNWGRITILVLSWLLMIYAVGFGIYFQIYIGNFSQALSGVQIYFRIMAILVNIAMIYGIFSLIRYINSNEIRQAVHSNLDRL